MKRTTTNNVTPANAAAMVMCMANLGRAFGSC